MKREAELALDSLRKQNTELGKGGTDSTPDITAPTSYEQRDVVQNDDGSWGETITEEESPIKKILNNVLVNWQVMKLMLLIMKI